MLEVWDKRSKELLNKEVGMFSGPVSSRMLEIVLCGFSLVYGSLSRDDRTLLW